MYARCKDTQILALDFKDVLLSSHQYGQGRSLYFSGLPYSATNCKLLLRSIYYVASKEEAPYIVLL